MKRVNKFGFGFNLALSIFLIVQGVLMFISAVLFYLMGLLSIVFIFFLGMLGLAIHFCSFIFIVGGAINIAFTVKNKTGEYSNLWMRIALILFNASFFVYYFLFFLFELLFLSIQDALLMGMASPFFAGIYLIPTLLIAIILLLITCIPNKKKIIKRNILTLIGSVFTLCNIVVLVYSYYYFPVHPFVLGSMGLLVIFFIVYLIIDLCRRNKSAVEVETVESELVENTTKPMIEEKIETTKE